MKLVLMPDTLQSSNDLCLNTAEDLNYDLFRAQNDPEIESSQPP